MLLFLSLVSALAAGKKQLKELRQAREFEVRVWAEEFLVQRVLRGYCGTKQKSIAEYIRNQLEEDYAADQISIKEYADPFTGDKIGRHKKAAA